MNIKTISAYITCSSHLLLQVPPYLGFKLVFLSFSGLYMMLQLSGSIYEYSLTTKGEILMYVSSVGFLNSLMNPLIYATKIPVVKQRFKKIFCCTEERRQSLHRLSLSTLTISAIFKTNSSQTIYRATSRDGQQNKDLASS